MGNGRFHPLNAEGSRPLNSRGKVVKLALNNRNYGPLTASPQKQASDEDQNTAAGGGAGGQASESQGSSRHHLVQTLPVLLTFLSEDAEVLAF